MTPELVQPATGVATPLRTTQMLTFDPQVMTRALQQGVLEHVQTLAGLAPIVAPHEDVARFTAAEVELAHDELLAAALGELARRGGANGAATALAPSERWKVIRRAEEYVEARGDQSVRIDDLCVAACTGLSRLERAFRETFGVGPRRYLGSVDI